jgi:phosphatidylglycerophosphatase A
VKLRPRKRQTQGLAPWSEVFRKSPLAASVATWFGAGFLPIAPGTWGSAATVPLAELLYRNGGVAALSVFAALAGILGILAADVAARRRGAKDPSEVVVDEVAGQAIALVPVYLLAPRSKPVFFWAAVLAAFLAFRVIDVWKPGPVRTLEALPGGLGIMADDLLGGALVAVSMAGALLALRALA